MSRPVFGRDRDPLAAATWVPAEPRQSCRPGLHLVDQGLKRCTLCGWLDPEVARCATLGCDRPAEYGVDVARADDVEFTNVLQSAAFCASHAFGGGLALIPDGPAA